VIINADDGLTSGLDMTPEELDEAVGKGILTPEQAQALKMESAKRIAGSYEEPFALVDNFGAVFVGVGLVILQGAPWMFSAVLPGGQPFIYSGFAAIYWMLAEGFAAGRRRLPATVAILLFVYDGAVAGMLLVDHLMTESVALTGLASVPDSFYLLVVLLLAIALFRFRLPLLVLALAISIVVLALKTSNASTLWILGSCGLVSILIGIVLDLRDPMRIGIWHEWAMWLFVVGSPLSVHPLFISLIRERLQNGLGDNAMIAMMLALAFAVSFVGLLLDRRSLVASTLIYLACAFGYWLVRTVGDPVSLLGIIPLTIGTYVIVLGVAWRAIRRKLLSVLPGQPLFRLLPRYEP
jgi:hypothetical protein